jgi:hypothetical protein
MRLTVIALLVLAVGPTRSMPPDGLPRFTEEREAAALCFVKKHAPEVLFLLERLKKDNLQQYQLEIREVFYVTEVLAGLLDDPKRYDLELRIWKAESKAYTLVARLATPSEEERKRVETALLDLARELVELDNHVLELKAEQLDKELGEIRDELTRQRDQMDKVVRSRYDGLVSKVKKPRK